MAGGHGQGGDVPPHVVDDLLLVVGRLDEGAGEDGVEDQEVRLVADELQHVVCTYSILFHLLYSTYSIVLIQLF